MKKFLKILGFISGGAIALVLILAIAIRIFLTPERVRAFIEKQASAQLHREVKLGGISVGLISGLTIKDFALSEYPGFVNGTFVSAEEFVLHPRLLPLLSKKLFIKNVTLVKPMVSLIREADGKTFNYSTLTSSSPATTTDSQTPSAAISPSPLTFLISKAVIESGHVSFIDRSPAAQSADIRDLNLTVRNVSLVSPVELRTDFQLKTKGIEARVDFDGAVHPLKGSARIKQLHLKSGGSALTVTGEATEITSPNAAFDFNLKIDRLEPTLLRAANVLPDTVRMNGPLTGTMTLKGTRDNGQFKLNLDGAHTEIVYSTSFKKPVATPMNLQVSGQYALPLAMTLSDIQFKLSQVVFSGNGTYKSVEEKSAYAFNLKSNSFPLEDFSPMVPSMQGYGLTGKATVATNIVSSAAGPVVAGTLTASQVKHDFLDMQSLQLQWDLKQATDLAKINGTAALKTGAGAFQNIQKLMPDSKWAKLFLTPIALLQKVEKASHGALGLPSFDNVNYKTITGEYLFGKGAMDIRSFNLQGTDLSAEMNGKVGLTGPQPLDLKAQLKLAAKLVGSATVHLIIKGTMAEPKPSLDTAKTGEQILKGVTEKWGDKPVQELEKALKGLFKR